jgi:hypothetical protein
MAADPEDLREFYRSLSSEQLQAQIKNYEHLAERARRRPHRAMWDPADYEARVAVMRAVLAEKGGA